MQRSALSRNVLYGLLALWPMGLHSNGLPVVIPSAVEMAA
jgi:hypothetical protein